MQVNTIELKEIQNRGLKILSEIDAVCRRNNIRYFLEGGTLLGAIRHNGFIPWDDDIDISMLRADYEKFVRLADIELPKQYFLQSFESDPNFPFGFARIVDLKTKFFENKNIFRTGFCIDVFPIDNAHDNRLIHNFNIFKIKIIQGLSKSKIVINYDKYNSLTSKLAIRIGSLLGKLFSTQFLMRAQRNIAIKSNKQDTKFKCYYAFPFNSLKCLFPSECYKSTQEGVFENLTIPIPQGWHELLTIRFGDYMTPPPEKERKPSHGYDKLIILDE